MLSITKVGGDKPPFPTCKLAHGESLDSTSLNLQAVKGGLPPLTRFRNTPN